MTHCSKTAWDPILGQTSIWLGALAGLLSGPHFSHYLIAIYPDDMALKF